MIGGQIFFKYSFNDFLKNDLGNSWIQRAWRDIVFIIEGKIKKLTSEF